MHRIKKSISLNGQNVLNIETYLSIYLIDKLKLILIPTKYSVCVIPGKDEDLGFK